MKRSGKKILTTHTGSLPRPRDLLDLVDAKEKGDLLDLERFDASARAAVARIVEMQADTGLDVVSDGEQSKPGYATYAKDRLTGFEGESTVRMQIDLEEFPEFSSQATARYQYVKRPACNGPIAWKDFGAVQKDIVNLKSAIKETPVEEAFMTAASPGVIALFLNNEYFPSEEDYLYALAEVMRDEYRAIVEAGFVLQIDCPDLAMGRNSQFAHLSLEDFRKVVELHVEVLNYALEDIQPEQTRLHLCWGNREGPHHYDIPIKDIIDLVLRARPAAISFPASNPRHAHEWKVWRDVKLPDDKVIIPGVLDTTTNYVEHPELVAERIVRYAGLVGHEKVIAGTDCGFGTFARTSRVDPKIAWLKLKSLVEGARLASEELG
ncbi:MAG: cobalamin-independent methionine synthase II family protein [Chloroflexi bacterium]|nr:cobalamin-independent methionine synthase II family protein [Chloroflexota bacterium]